MPADDIERSHSHLPPHEQQQPAASRRGLISRLFGFLKTTDPQWKQQSPKAGNWQSFRGSYDPVLPYPPGRPQKAGQAVTNPLPDRPAEEFDSELAAALVKRFPAIVPQASKQMATFLTTTQDLIAVLTFLRDETSYSWPAFMTAVDWPTDNQLELLYALRNLESGKLVSIHLRVERHQPKVPSTARIFRSFDWHEREVYELYGVQFEHHPDLRKLLLDSSYPGYPLLKGYTDEEHEFITRPY